MTEELIELPDLKEVKEMCVIARQDIESEVKENPDLKASSQLIFEVISVIEEKLSKGKNVEKLSIKEKIDVAAHLNFLHVLLEDFFYVEDEDFEEDDLEYSEEEFEDEE